MALGNTQTCGSIRPTNPRAYDARTRALAHLCRCPRHGPRSSWKRDTYLTDKHNNIGTIFGHFPNDLWLSSGASGFSTSSGMASITRYLDLVKKLALSAFAKLTFTDQRLGYSESFLESHFLALIWARYAAPNA